MTSLSKLLRTREPAVFFRACACESGRGMEGKKVRLAVQTQGADLPGFCDSVRVYAWYVPNVFHVYIMTINLMSSLESISPSRSMREDSIYQFRWPDSPDRVWRARLGRYGWVASNGVEVGCSPFLPTTESDSYRERASFRERESVRENKLQRESVKTWQVCSGAQTYFSFPSPAHFRTRMRIRGKIRLAREIETIKLLLPSSYNIIYSLYIILFTSLTKTTSYSTLTIRTFRNIPTTI